MQGRDELQSPRSHTNVDFNSLLVKNKSPLQCSHTVRDEYTRGSTLLAIAYVSVNQATYLMVTESPDRIRVTQR